MFSFSIREAGPEDAEVICVLIDELAAYERLAHASNPDPEALRRHLRVDARPRCEALLAETVDGEVAGFVLFFHTYSTFLTNWGLYLEDLFVRPAYRGRGVGFALLKRLAAVALDRECARVEWQVLDWNRPAIDFYERLGAVHLDDWRTMRITGSALRALVPDARG